MKQCLAAQPVVTVCPTHTGRCTYPHSWCSMVYLSPPEPLTHCRRRGAGSPRQPAGGSRQCREDQTGHRCHRRAVEEVTDPHRLHPHSHCKGGGREGGDCSHYNYGSQRETRGCLAHLSPGCMSARDSAASSFCCRSAITEFRKSTCRVLSHVYHLTAHVIESESHDPHLLFIVLQGLLHVLHLFL